MDRKYNIGEHVIYVDKWGIPRDALVTIWWGDIDAYKKNQDPKNEPGCNLVIVSGDPARDDSYGRQTERETSVVHKSNQPAHGFYWCWRDELTDEQTARLNAAHHPAD